MKNTAYEPTGVCTANVRAFLQCPRRAWKERHEPVARKDAFPASREVAMNMIQAIIRQRYSRWLHIGVDTSGSAVEATRRALLLPSLTLFDAVFKHGSLMAKADIVHPCGEAFCLTLLTLSTSVKDSHIREAALVYRIASGAGLPVNGVSVLCVNNKFLYDGVDYTGLLREEDVTSRVITLSCSVDSWIHEARTCLEGAAPDIPSSTQCAAVFCPYAEDCAPQEEYPVELLPRIGRRAQELRDLGFADLRDVPTKLLSSSVQRRVRAVTRDGNAVLDKAAGTIIKALPRPRYYLDFESIQVPVPLWSGTKPYQQIPFQWSCHREDSDGCITHAAFLAKGRKDPRRAFVRGLLQQLGSSGPVLAYNAAFEGTRLKELALVFPDVEPKLNALCARLVDLLPIARNHYYHPAMRGSWSIKAVLPTIDRDLDYRDLAISDGQMAGEAFSRLLQPDIGKGEKKRLRQHLLDYCHRDTLALVRLTHFFSGR